MTSRKQQDEDTLRGTFREIVEARALAAPRGKELRIED